MQIHDLKQSTSHPLFTSMHEFYVIFNGYNLLLRYKITYRQRVTSEDIYLNMSGRLPSITDSDDLVLSIHMPGIKTASELELTCEKDKVDVRCEK